MKRLVKFLAVLIIFTLACLNSLIGVVKFINDEPDAFTHLSIGSLAFFVAALTSRITIRDSVNKQARDILAAYNKRNEDYIENREYKWCTCDKRKWNGDYTTPLCENCGGTFD